MKAMPKRTPFILIGILAVGGATVLFFPLAIVPAVMAACVYYLIWAVATLVRSGSRKQSGLIVPIATIIISLCAIIYTTVTITIVIRMMMRRAEIESQMMYPAEVQETEENPNNQMQNIATNAANSDL